MFPGADLQISRACIHPTLIVNEVSDEVVPVKNSCWLSADFPNAGSC